MNKVASRHLAAFFFISSLAAPVAFADGKIRLDKRLADDEILAAPSTITASLYTTQDAVIPMVIQTYYEGEWQLTKNDETRFLRISVDADVAPSGSQLLWAELEADGMPVGERFIIRAVAPNMSVEGYVESRTVGFKFPDGTTQSTAANTSDTDWIESATTVTTDKLVGIGMESRAYNQISSFSGLTVQGPVDDDWGGMYVNVNDTGGDTKPFYGYATNGSSKAWTEFSELTGEWSVHNDGIYFIVENTGRVRIPGSLTVAGTIAVDGLVASGSDDVCRHTVSKELATCSSSGRYKENVAPLSLGLDTVAKLQPVTFNWKDGQGHDLGFVAEEVAIIDPILATYTDRGEVEGVKYKQLTAVLVNAVKEQQKEIATLREELQQYKELAEGVAELKREIMIDSKILAAYKE